MAQFFTTDQIDERIGSAEQGLTAKPTVMRCGISLYGKPAICCA
ncbi:hypothetical protein SEEM5278_21368, partial [Salmonella enterica subsp. enterica serovar Montevideo str. CT_02035278]